MLLNVDAVPGALLFARRALLVSGIRIWCRAAGCCLEDAGYGTWPPAQQPSFAAAAPSEAAAFADGLAAGFRFTECAPSYTLLEPSVCQIVESARSFGQTSCVN